jgi:hypothetical protein
VAFICQIEDSNSRSADRGQRNEPAGLERVSDMQEALSFLNRSDVRASSKRVAVAGDQVGDGAETFGAWCGNLSHRRDLRRAHERWDTPGDMQRSKTIG